MSITPESLVAKCNSEHCHQTALFCQAALHFGEYPQLKLMFAVPNGGERNKIVAGNLKAEGVKAGVPDICLPVARGGYHGLFIEMKVKPNTPSVDQLTWITELHAQGYAAIVCYSWLEAWKKLVEYLALR